MTQSELAKGICAQNIISRIERHNFMPTVSILVKICKKLDITLNDLFSDFSSATLNEKERLFFVMDKEIVRNNLGNVSDIIEIIENADLNKEDRVQLNFYKALLLFLKKQDCYFELDLVLSGTGNNIYNIYTILTYIIKAQTYYNNNKLYEANYYYNIILKVTKENVEIPGARIIHKIYVCKSVAEFCINQKNYKMAILYAKRGLSINRNENTVYFLDILYLILSKASINNGDKRKYLELSKSFNFFIKYDNSQKEELYNFG